MCESNLEVVLDEDTLHRVKAVKETIDANSLEDVFTIALMLLNVSIFDGPTDSDKLN